MGKSITKKLYERAILSGLPTILSKPPVRETSYEQLPQELLIRIEKNLLLPDELSELPCPLWSQSNTGRGNGYGDEYGSGYGYGEGDEPVYGDVCDDEGWGEGDGLAEFTIHFYVDIKGRGYGDGWYGAGDKFGLGSGTGVAYSCYGAGESSEEGRGLLIENSTLFSEKL